MSNEAHVIGGDLRAGRFLANAVLWLLQIVAAALILMAAAAKLTGVEQAVNTFAQLGLGQWFRFAVGIVEVAGAVLLLVPRFARVAALLLAPVLTGAVFTHLAIIGGSPAPAVTVLVMLVTIALGRRPRARSR